MKVLGIGNALVDIMTRLKDDLLLEEHQLLKGGMQLVDMEFIEKLTQGTALLVRHQASGGSAANTIHGLARLGVETGFMGKVGQDELGDFFKSDLEKSNINPKLFMGKSGSGRAFALVSPDTERTFATCLGAAVEMKGEELLQEHFDGYDIFHIEGYLVQNQELLSKAVKLAKEAGMKVSLDLASYNVVEDNLDFLKSIVAASVDILFANEQETFAFTGKKPEEAIDEMALLCETAIVKMGPQGSLIKTGGQIYNVGVIDVNAVDTTGAGDLYASGFIYGMIKGYDPGICGRIGAVLSGKVIEVIGAKMDDEEWNQIRKMIGEITGNS